MFGVFMCINTHVYGIHTQRKSISTILDYWGKNAKHKIELKLVEMKVKRDEN